MKTLIAALVLAALLTGTASATQDEPVSIGQSAAEQFDIGVSVQRALGLN